MESDDNFQDNSFDSIKIDDSIAENARLNEMVQELQKQKNELTQQFEAAMESIQSLDEIKRENAQLRAQINKLKANNEDVLQRLKISEETKEGLSKKVETTLAESEKSHRNELEQLQAKLLTAQTQSKCEIDKLKLKVQSNDDMTTKAQTENALLKNQMGKILQLAGNYFRSKIEEPKQLIDILLHPHPDNNELIQQTNLINEQEKKKYKQVKSSLEKEKARCKQLELDLLQLHQASDAETAKFNSQTAEFQDTIRKLQNKINAMENDHKQEIVTLTKKLTGNRKLHSMMTQTSEYELGGSQLLQKANGEIESLRSKTRELETEIAQQKAHIIDLEEQAKDNEEIRQKLQNKSEQSRTKNEKLSKEIKNSQYMINELNEELEKSKAEKKELLKQIKGYETTKNDINSQQEKTIKDLENTKNALEILEQHMNEQSEEIAQITIDRDHLLSLVHTQNQALLAVESLIAESKPVVEQPSIMNAKELQNEVVETTNWNFGTLPDDLQSILKGIAENDGFSIEKRISQMFNVVSRWFSNFEFTNQSKLKELTEKVELANKALTDFAASILQAIDRDSLDIDEIVEAVSEIYKSNFVLQQKINELKSIPEVCDQATFDEMTHKIEALEECVKLLKSKYLRQKNQTHEVKSALIVLSNRNDEEKQTMKKSIDQSRETIDQLQTEIDALHKQNQDLLEELSDSKNLTSKDYNEAQKEIEAIMIEQSAKYEEMKQDLNMEIRTKNDQIVSLENKLKETEATAKKWEENSLKVQEETRKVKSEMNLAIIEKDDQFARMVHQKEQELQQIKDYYQSMIDQLNGKANETDFVIQSNLKEMKEHDQLMKQMQQQIADLTFQLQKADLTAQSQIDSIERKKKLAVAQLKAQLMAVETKYSVIADEQKHKWEAEKRSLFCYFAQQFGPFFDAKQSLNEESFKQIVNKIKIELDKHKKQEQTIRKLLKANENQTTEDALADLVLSIHPQLQKPPGAY